MGVRTTLSGIETPLLPNSTVECAAWMKGSRRSLRRLRAKTQKSPEQPRIPIRAYSRIGRSELQPRDCAVVVCGPRKIRRLEYLGCGPPASGEPRTSFHIPWMENSSDMHIVYPPELTTAVEFLVDAA